MRTWCEVETSALAWNIRQFRRHVGESVILAHTVKANPYGHGLRLAAQAFCQGGADWLSVDAVEEARALRQAGISTPIYILGYVPLAELEEAVSLEARLVVYNRETVARLRSLGHPARVHLKIETGNSRQGVEGEAARALADEIRLSPGLVLEGACSHFANIEDTTDHAFARQQRRRFDEEVAALRARGHELPIRHLSNSAAALLWPDRSYEMVRLGIGGYGLWPSKEAMVAAHLAGRSDVELRPALSWKTRIAQVKWVPVGAYVGYGCTYMTTHKTRLAVLPVGYYDGYDRGLSNLAHVLIGGRRAPVRGRVCMNMTMVDITDIPDAQLEAEVVLMGRQASEQVSAEMLAEWAGTINYEIVTRIAAHVPRQRQQGSASAAAAASGGEIYRG